MAKSTTTSPTKLSFAFTGEDMRLLKSVQRTLAQTQGKVSNITAIRYALRSATQKAQ